MYIFKGHSLSNVYLELVNTVMKKGNKVSPRGLPIKELQPAVTILESSQKMLFCPGRNWNPFFAIAEVLWILAGREDVEWICQFNKSLKQYSNNGRTFDGAYGHRLKEYWGIDQIKAVYDRLGEDRRTRQAVMCLWDPVIDNKPGSFDYPCNDLVMFKIREGQLNMTVCNRSNDLILGLPYNVMVFGTIQKILAQLLRVNVGKQIHFSDSLHIYQDVGTQAIMQEIWNAVNEYPNFWYKFGEEMGISRVESMLGDSHLGREQIDYGTFKDLEVDLINIFDIIDTRRQISFHYIGSDGLYVTKWGCDVSAFLISYLEFVDKNFGKCLDYLLLTSDLLFVQGMQHYIYRSIKKAKKLLKSGKEGEAILYRNFIFGLINHFQKRSCEHKWGYSIGLLEDLKFFVGIDKCKKEDEKFWNM